MGGSGQFVQLPHPGGEHRPDSDGNKAWHAYPRPHARKFMRLDGRWADEQGAQRSGELWAWGEWEAPSELIRRLDQPDSPAQPGYLWEPYYTDRPGGYKGLHNSDPFIFGEQILYSNCRQASRPGLRHLERGSVIAFGSGSKHRWGLDTVVVVAAYADYRAADAPVALADCVPGAFLEVTGEPLADNDAAEEFRLYRGATPDNPVDGMFSFFPARQADGDTGFERPSIDLPRAFFTKKNMSQNCKISDPLTAETLSGLWQAIVAQVLDAGLLLGTGASPPNKRKA